MDYLLWFFVFSAFVIYAASNAMEKADWCFVIKYTANDYVGVVIDAHFVMNSCDAIYRASLGPMKPGEMLRAAWAINDKQRSAAITLHDQKMKQDRDWALFTENMEDGWLHAQQKKVFRDS